METAAGGVAGVQLLVDMADVGVHGGVADAELISDSLFDHALGEQSAGLRTSRWERSCSSCVCPAPRVSFRHFSSRIHRGSVATPGIQGQPHPRRVLGDVFL